MQKNNLFRGIDNFYSFANLILKFAQSENLVSKLQHYISTIQNTELKLQLENLLKSYQELISLISNKDADKEIVFEKISDLAMTLNEIRSNPYTDIDLGAFQEEFENQDFDPEKFNELLNDIQIDITDKVSEGSEEVFEEDPVDEAKREVVEAFNKIKDDPDFVEVMKAGNIANAVTFIRNNYPEIKNLMDEIENLNDLQGDDWKEIMDIFSDIRVDPYKPGGRIIDRNKQRDYLSAWRAAHPQKVFEYQRKRWNAIKSDPKKYKEYLNKVKENRRKFISDLEERAKKDPLAKLQLENIKKNQNLMTKKVHETRKKKDLATYFITDEYGKRIDVLKDWKYFTPEEKEKYKDIYEKAKQSVPEGFNKNLLLNKLIFVRESVATDSIARKMNGLTFDKYKSLSKDVRDELRDAARKTKEYKLYLEEQLLPAIYKDETFKELNQTMQDEIINAAKEYIESKKAKLA